MFSQLLKFDKELSVFKDRLHELEISFPPRYQHISFIHLLYFTITGTLRRWNFRSVWILKIFLSRFFFFLAVKDLKDYLWQPLHARVVRIQIPILCTYHSATLQCEFTSLIGPCHIMFLRVFCVVCLLATISKHIFLIISIMCCILVF